MSDVEAVAADPRGPAATAAGRRPPPTEEAAAVIHVTASTRALGRCR